MAHRNYHEIDANSPSACGRALGKMFGSIIRGYLAESREDEDWQELLNEAKPLLQQTARYFPAYVEELDAYADAAGVPLIELWAMSIEDELGDDDYEKCTTVVTNNGRLIAHNEDWDPDASDDICILKKRCGDTTTLELYYYGCPLGGTALSISSNGYVQAINSLNHTDWQIGVPKLVIARRMAEIRSLDAELNGVLAVPRSSGFAHNLVGSDGDVCVVECTAMRHSVRYPDTPSIHTNHLLSPTLRCFQDETDGKSTFRRYDSACDLARPGMDMASMKELMSDESRGAVSSLFNRNTIARAIVDIDQQTASFWLRRERKKGWIDYPINFLCDKTEFIA